MHGIDEGPVTLGDADNHVADMQFSATRRGPPGENSVYCRVTIFHANLDTDARNG